MISKKRGFTLVEIMIVVSIIALLAAIAIPNLIRAKVSANDAAAQGTLKSISTALESYMTVNNVYPTDPNSLLGAAPPYLSKDYFTGTHNGFTFTPTLAAYSYSITATPLQMGQSGTASYTITTGAVLQTNP